MSGFKSLSTKPLSRVLLASVVLCTIYIVVTWNAIDKNWLRDTVLSFSKRMKSSNWQPNKKGIVYSFRNVCIEGLHGKVNNSLQIVPGFLPFTENKQIVVYDSQV